MEPGKTWKNSPLRRNIIFQTFMFGFFDCQKQWRETGGIPPKTVVLCMCPLYTWTHLCGLLTQLYTLTSSGSYFFVDSLVLLLFWNLMLFWIAYLMSTVTTNLPFGAPGTRPRFRGQVLFTIRLTSNGQVVMSLEADSGEQLLKQEFSVELFV